MVQQDRTACEDEDLEYEDDFDDIEIPSDQDPRQYMNAVLVAFRRAGNATSDGAATAPRRKQFYTWLSRQDSERYKIQ